MFYLPGVCTQTITKGKQRRARVWNILKSLDKNTIFNEHPVLPTVKSIGRGRPCDIKIGFFFQEVGFLFPEVEFRCVRGENMNQSILSGTVQMYIYVMVN